MLYVSEFMIVTQSLIFCRFPGSRAVQWNWNHYVDWIRYQRTWPAMK